MEKKKVLLKIDFFIRVQKKKKVNKKTFKKIRKEQWKDFKNEKNMQHKYIIIDESEKKEEKICGIGCVLIDSKEEIEKLKEKIESCKEELGF